MKEDSFHAHSHHIYHQVGKLSVVPELFTFTRINNQHLKLCGHVFFPAKGLTFSSVYLKAQEPSLTSEPVNLLWILFHWSAPPIDVSIHLNRLPCTHIHVIGSRHPHMEGIYSHDILPIEPFFFGIGQYG